jgi:subtilase family serine protease
VRRVWAVIRSGFDEGNMASKTVNLNRVKKQQRHNRSSGHHASPFAVEMLEQRLLLAVNWDHGGDGVSWSDPANWSGDQLPGAQDDVRITGGATGQFTVRLDADATVKSLLVGSTSCSSQPRLQVREAAVTTSVGVSIIGCGQLQLDAAELDGPVVNRATLRIHGGSAINGPVTQEGTLVIEGNAEFGDATLILDRSLTNRSFTSLTSTDGPFDATLTIASGNLINQSSLYADVGSGGERSINAPLVNHSFVNVLQELTFNASVVNNSSMSVRADTHVATDLHNNNFVDLVPNALLEVLGAFTQTQDGFLSIGLGGGDGEVGAGQLRVTGTATLNGDLDFDVDLEDEEDRPPGNGESIPIVSYASRTGSFASISGLNQNGGLEYTVQVTDTAVVLQAPVLADFVVDAVNAPASATMHQTVSLSWTVQNTGPDSDDSVTWYDEVFLSDDEQFDRFSDRSLGYQQFDAPPLLNGESYTLDLDVHIPSADAGQYFLFVATDSFQHHFESDETNNVGMIPITLTPPDADLRPTSLVVPSTVVAGQRFEATWTVQNFGSVATEADSWNDYLSIATGPTADTIIATIGSRTLFQGEGGDLPLAAGASYSVGIPETVVNVAPGNYFLLVQVDQENNQGETDGANNAHAIPITVVAPDLTVTAAASPAAAVLGDTINVSWTIENQGDHPAAANWYDAVYLSSDTVFDSSDRAVHYLFGPPSQPVASGESYTLNQSVRLPGNAAAGPQFLLFLSDAFQSQAENNEENNVLARPITLFAPDLTVTGATAPVTAAPAESIDVSFTVQNLGQVPAAADWIDYIYLSDDQSFDPSDLFVRNFSQADKSPLDPGASYTHSTTVTMSEQAIAGSRFLLFIADGVGTSTAQTETSEENNVFAVPIEIKVPDLLVTTVSAPASAVVGSNVLFSWTVSNQGQASAFTDWFDAIFLSDDANLDSSDRNLRSVSTGSFTPLAASGQYTFNQSVTLPTDLSLGPKFVIVVADNNLRQTELDETNNSLTRSIEITGADLRPTVFNAPAEAISGATISFSWTVLNEGLVSALGSWQDAVYISDDDALDGSDLELRRVSHSSASPVAAGGSYNLSTNYFLDADDVKPGSKFLLLRADRANQLSETDESDNVIARPITINAPDITVTAATAPASINVGQSFEVSWTVTNQGQFSTQTTWSDLIVLSRDNKYDQGDTTVFQRFIGSPQTPLGPGGSYTLTQTVTPQEFVNNAAFLLFVGDGHNQHGEVDETNNVFAIPISLTSPDLAIIANDVPTTAVIGSEIDI